jgi:hypothetical protein
MERRVGLRRQCVVCAVVIVGQALAGSNIVVDSFEAFALCIYKCSMQRQVSTTVAFAIVSTDVSWLQFG